ANTPSTVAKPAFDPLAIQGLDALPPNAFTLLGVRSIRTFSEFVGTETITKRRDWLALPFTGRQLYFGLNPLDPEQLTGFGVDVDAPAALVALGPSWMEFAAVARL